MNDIADKSSNAILRPAAAPRWRIVGTETELISASILAALSESTFGKNTELSYEGAEDCCGAIFTSTLDGGILTLQYWQLKYFFSRDGAEARVFEYDRWQRNFIARRLEELNNRRK